MPANPHSVIKLEPKQALDFETPATEVLYGGAAGGMKSFTKRASAIRWCAEVPGIQVYLFRRTLTDLRDNHLRGPTSLQMMLDPYIAGGHVKYRSVENEFEFWNGSVLHLCYCDSENDVEKYRGAEIHVLIMDELTHFSEYQYRFLRSRVRIAGLTVPDKYKTRLPRIETASNPGSIGHAWVKRTFISPKPPMEVWRTSSEEGGMLRQFIPAKLADNPYLTRDDPSYADRLRGLGSDNLVRAMLDGDWDIIAGQAFEKLRRDIHCIDPFEPPEDWATFGSLDWGSSRPFSFGLWTVANGNQLPDGRLYRRGAIIRYNEVYGWNGKPNEGLRKEAKDVAEMIKSRIKNRKLGYICADPSMWKVDGGPSVAETFLRHGVALRRADNSRLVGYVQVRQRIAGDEEGPMLYATRNCHDGFWRTMPDIVMDEKHVEDVDTDQEDHAYDECFIADTRIATENGSIRISELRVGDCVLTRQGALPVTAVFTNGIKDVLDVLFSDGSKLTGTGNHPVFVLGTGFVALRDLRYGDMMRTWNIQTSTEQRQGFCGVNYEVLFPLGISSIMSMGMKKITVLKILLASVRRSIADITRNSCKNIICGVSSATMIFLAWLGTRVSAPMLASQLGGGQNELMTRNVNAFHVGKNLEPTNTQRSDIVHYPARRLEHISEFLQDLIAVIAEKVFGRRKKQPSGVPIHVVSVTTAGKQQVFNLTVSGAEEYFAAGVLVHNCRYACMSRPWMTEVKKPTPPPDRWMKFEEKEEESWRTA